VSKPAPRLIGVQSGVAGASVGQDGALALGVAGTPTVTQNGPLTIGPGEEWTASAGCPSGLATGGGESNNSSGGVVLNQSYAYGDGSGWIVEVRNQSAQSATYTVYAVCATGLTNYTTVNSNITLGPGQYGEADADCPEGTNVRGTGVQAGLKAGIQYSFTKRKIEAAFVDVTNLDSNTAQYAAQAICAAGTPLGDNESGGKADLPPNGYVKATDQVSNASYGVFSGGGGAPDATSGTTYVTDSFPDTSDTGNAAWSVWVRNTSNTDEYAIGTLYDTSS
jgi:hypothetical protein